MNNFNQSSLGVNLELTIKYDNDLASMWFEDELITIINDNFSLLNSGYRGVNILQVTCCGELAEIKLHDLNNWIFTKEELKQALLDSYGDGTRLNEVNYISKHYFDKPFNRLTKPELIEFVENDFYDNSCIVEFAKEHFTFKHQVISSRGYCQGDYVEIIIPNDYWKITSQNPDNNDMQDYLDNLIWSQPIYSNLVINDNDELFRFEEYVLDSYKYDKDEYLNIAKKHLVHSERDIIIDWLESNLPSEPDYN